MIRSKDIVSWHERLRRAPGGSSGWSPPVDVYETEDDYVLVIELPGLDAQDFGVHATDDALTVSGRRANAGAGEGRFLHVERGHGAFSRTFSFPQRIDVGAVRADFSDGLLTIAAPKQTRPIALRIEIG